MAKNTSPVVIPEHLVSPISINGMRGRKVSLPAKHTKHEDREFIFFYGHHGSLERVYAFGEFLNDYGSVTIYDTPGFGGMDSFYQIGKKPTLDMYADYLHAIFLAHKRKKHTTVVGMSLTFTLLTRMFQKYPETTKYFDQVVSFVGFASYKNFRFYPRYLRYFKVAASVASLRPLSWFIRVVVFNPISLSLLMGFFLRYNPKMKDVTNEEKKETVQMEKDLWRRNDMRTHFATYVLMLSLSYPKAPKIPLHIYNMTTDNDQYFREDEVTSSLKKLYKSVSTSYLNLGVHVPSLVSTKDEVGAIIPQSVRDEVLENGS